VAELRTLTRGVATVTSARFLGLIFTMLQVKLTLSYLGEDDYGRLSTVTLMISLFAGLSELGIGTVIVRRVASQGRDLQSEVGVSLA
jgi:O-antigen/teichoic acid export membrane protein